MDSTPSCNLAGKSLGEWHHMWVRLKDGEQLNFFAKLKSILDVGCGNGRYLKYFSKRIQFAVGIDINKKAFIKELGLNFIVADAHNLPFKNGCFDLFFSTDVLEHLSKPLRALQEMRRVSLGRIYLCTPNKLCPVDMSKVASWFGTHKRPSIEKYVTKQELAILLKIAGFRNYLITTRSFLPLGWLVEHKKAKIPSAVTKILLEIESCLEKFPFIKNLAGVLVALDWG
ncbi:methyltransferase domain-containing protein [Candidatus Bathyarchaeota archaeon]|nr:methyltransferase domain-containing protein [Candidatus Bathyarchaeota archaeon]